MANIPDNWAMARLLSTAPYYSRCSDNKTAALSRPRNLAIDYAYMQVNRQDMVSWLVFDIDHSDPTVWLDGDLPEPNMVVSDPDTGTAHLYYAIKPVCTSRQGRAAPIRYMQAVYRAAARSLCADDAYRGPVAKTPFHPRWRTQHIHNGEFSLADLDLLHIHPDPPATAGNEDIPDSRNCRLFSRTRRFAYQIVKRHRRIGGSEAFDRQVMDYATQANTTHSKPRLPLSEVRALSRSVSRWTWNNYTGRHRSRVMRLDPQATTKEKQSQAARYVHNARRHSTALSIRHAVYALIRQHAAVNYTAIAKRTGLTRQTIANYQNDIEQAIQPAFYLSELLGGVRIARLDNSFPVLLNMLYIRYLSPCAFVVKCSMAGGKGLGQQLKPP